MKRLEGNSAIVTGAASGIGRALATELAARGARVVLADIDEQPLRAVAAELAGASAHVVDVADADAVQRLVDAAVDEHGKLDYIFNNAGICVTAEVLDLELADWERVIDVNLRGVIHGVHAAYPVMATQGFGHVVNIASVAGLIGGGFLAPYVATKHAVVGFTRSLRMEAAHYGVRVTCVCPGFVATSIYEHTKTINFDRDAMVEAIPFKMMAPDRCARQILRGVTRNKGLIVITPHGKWLARLQRWFPRLVDRIGMREAAKARRLRTKIAG